jgi:hypothetical protein
MSYIVILMSFQTIYSINYVKTQPWQHYENILWNESSLGWVLEQKYQTLMKFVEILASFPFSNAAVERTRFSLLKLIKINHCASLKSASLAV